MSVRQLSSMTWEEVRDLDRQTAVVVLPVGAIEAHGPHLPLSTDVIISEAMARSASELLVDNGYEVVVAPTIQYTPAGFASGFQGTISIGTATLQAMLRDIATSLAEHGFTTLAIANAHLDPAHLSAIDAFASDPSLPLKVVFPNLARRRFAARLTEEFQTGACHAGRFETSIVQAERADLVREELRRDLAPNPVSLSEAIGNGATRFEEIGGDRAYFGFPAHASAAEGHTSVETLGAILADAVMESFDGT
ncbi:MAG: creatininase family protein [Gemmatimonadales bacterium]